MEERTPAPLAGHRRTRSCQPMVFAVDLRESFKWYDEEDLYAAADESVSANTSDIAGHMSDAGVAFNSLSEPPTPNTHTCFSGDTQPQGPQIAEDHAPSSVVTQSESIGLDPFVGSAPLVYQSNNMDRPFDTGPGGTHYPPGMYQQAGFGENHPGLNPNAPTYQGYESTAAGPTPVMANIGQINTAGIHGGGNTAYPHPVSNPQFGYSMGEQPFGVHAPDHNMLRNAPVNVTGGGRSKAPQPTKQKTLDAITLEFLAFADGAIESGARNSMPPNAGVLKISSIPYSLTKEEVTSMLGRHAKLLRPEMGSAVHIIMERSTAKTMDCFVEFETREDAEESARYLNGGLPANPPRLGSRFVEVEVTTQDELLHALFPRAKCVSWKNGVPHIAENTDPYSTGFQGFFTYEEFYNVVRHAEHPRRAPFAEKCPQRTYENMVSTLYKFPWYATNLYTIEDRNVLFRSVRRQIVALDDIMKKKNTMGLNERLVQDLVFAAVRVPVFNERQKVSLFLAAKAEGMTNIPLSSKAWPFDALTRKVNIPEEAVARLANFMAQASQVHAPGTALLFNKWNEKEHSASGGLFGKVWFEWGWKNTHHNLQFAVDQEMQIIQDMAKALAQAEVEGRKG